MSVSRSARWGAGLVLLGSLAAGAGLGVGPLVRSRVAREAAKRACGVAVGGVRAGWFSLVLTDVRVELQGVDGIEVVLPRATVELSSLLRPKEVLIEDGRVTLKGDLEVLKTQLQAWRAAGAKGGTGEHNMLSVHATRTSVQWDEAQNHATLQGLDLTRDEGGLKSLFEKAEVRLGALTVELVQGGADFDPTATLKSVKLTEANVAWSLPEAPSEGATPAAPTTGDLAPPPLPTAVGKAGKGKKTPLADDVLPAPTAEASAPLITIPDLHGLRAVAASIGTLLAQRLPEGAAVSITGLKLRLERGGEERVSLGPGPLEVERRGARIEVTFSTGGGALGTPMSVHAVLPSDDGDVELSLAGGQVPLSLLGLHAKALTELDRATLAGKGRVVLEGKGKALTFDGQLTFRGLTAHDPRLSPDVVRGLDFDARARGVLSDRGELRLDEVEAAMGALRVEAHGGFEQTADHVSAALDFVLPVNSCEAVLGSIPTALVPTLRGAHMSGTLGAHGRLAFDTRKLDDLALDYTIEDRCRLSDVSGELDRDRFGKPFVHRIYTPDGKLAEETTGPTTENWTDLDHISPFMQVAVLTTEDGGFFHHHGFNHAAIRNSLLANIKARRFVRGASTITMQLAKNLFLSRDKTLSRKLEELILTDYLEQAFTKDEMMELYLNIIEFGPNVYGITAAADHYFGRRPEELNLAECMFLSSILPKPVHYHHLYEHGDLPESWLRGIRARMVIAQRTGKITEPELTEGLTEPVVFHRPNTPRPPARPPVMAPHAEEEGGGWQELN
jgi:hypothetical protein